MGDVSDVTVSLTPPRATGINPVGFTAFATIRQWYPSLLPSQRPPRTLGRFPTGFRDAETVVALLG